MINGLKRQVTRAWISPQKFRKSKLEETSDRGKKKKKERKENRKLNRFYFVMVNYEKNH